MSEPGLPPKQELTPEQQFKKRLKHATNQYRIAVRWLRDARIYKQNFAQQLTFEGKAWKDTPESELAEDAQKAYTEAVNGVLYWRRQIDTLNKNLMDLAGEKANGKKRAGRKKS